MYVRLLCLLLTCLFSVVSSAEAYKSKDSEIYVMQVVTLNDVPIGNVEYIQKHYPKISLEIFNLDDRYDLQDVVAKGLPTEPEKRDEAIAMAKKRLKLIDKQRVANTFKAPMYASKYGINRVPAIVINNTCVIFGITDLRQAVAIYKRERAER